jgi:hypothetical protein
MYQPIAERIIDYARQNHEDPVIIARAIKACRQPGDSAPHNDHMHVRIYCSDTDREFGCVDIGPMELLAEREAEKQKTLQLIANALPHSDPAPATAATEAWPGTAFAPAPTLGLTSTATPGITSTPLPAGPTDLATSSGVMSSTNAPSASFSSLLRARADRIDLRGWR